MNDNESPTKVIAEFVSQISYRQLPDEAIQIAKKSIIDGIGTCIAGAESSPGRIISDYVNERASSPEATVITKGFKTSAPEVAMANGTMMHALDYDDCSDIFLGHPTTVILPAVLALGEWLRISGRDLILSYILGYEVCNRIGSGIGSSYYEAGWHSTATIGTLGAAIAATKILKLNVPQIRTAIGIAASLAGGLRQNFGTMTKPLHAGNAARNGVFAALLAQKGFTADPGILENPFGFSQVFSRSNQSSFTKMTSKLGRPFEIVANPPILKLYPSCRGTAGCIDAILHLIRWHDINAESVVEVECRTSSHTPKELIHSRPRTALEGKFSLEYCMAVAIIDKQMGLKQFTDDKVNDTRIQELIPKVKYTHPPEMGSTSADSMRGRVEVVVRLMDGTELSRLVEAAKGDPRNPLTVKEMDSKFLDCAQVVFSRQDAKRILNEVSTLERIEDISELMRLLGSPPEIK